ncbi:hypothetical protein FGG08_006783 [Glutinoglossum americanum]|uniref:Uncharacterized protein n=1 Tax=Glutinoglossum americanum TaxID=1670608 RepID=A0A9P8I6M6_9PEZI|nr:hypothetical protein FGG08_006783 [Glutinoglossum americanum]
MHVPLIDEIVRLYDDSAWRVRDPIRNIEKVFTNRFLSSEPNFEEMYEISRHTIHVSEVLSATIEAMEGIQRQQKAIYRSLPELVKTYQEQAQEYMSFQLLLLKNLKLRCSSNRERLKDEIALVIKSLMFSLPTHGSLQVQINAVTVRHDNAVMKSIALLTMIFLPATFVSAFFSTTFFTFGDNSPKASKQLWVYWAITIPSTLLVIVIWRLWLRGSLNLAWKMFFVRRRLAKLTTGVTV